MSTPAATNLTVFIEYQGMRKGSTQIEGSLWKKKKKKTGRGYFGCGARKINENINKIELFDDLPRAIYNYHRLLLLHLVGTGLKIKQIYLEVDTETHFTNFRMSRNLANRIQLENRFLSSTLDSNPTRIPYHLTWQAMKKWKR